MGRRDSNCVPCQVPSSGRDLLRQALDSEPWSLHGRLPPERLPVGLVRGVDVEGRTLPQSPGQNTKSLHLADVHGGRPKTGHVEAFDPLQVSLPRSAQGQDRLVVRVPRIREEGPRRPGLSVRSMQRRSVIRALRQAQPIASRRFRQGRQ
jgi:hypothetical protein